MAQQQQPSSRACTSLQLVSIWQLVGTSCSCACLGVPNHAEQHSHHSLIPHAAARPTKRKHAMSAAAFGMSGSSQATHSTAKMAGWKLQAWKLQALPETCRSSKMDVGSEPDDCLSRAFVDGCVNRHTPWILPPDRSLCLQAAFWQPADKCSCHS